MSSQTISAFDVEAHATIRRNVEAFMVHCASTYARQRNASGGPPLLLDVAPQDHKGATPFFSGITVATLDIDMASGASYIADLCDRDAIARLIGSSVFDFIVCTEVLEHTRQPFDATQSIFDLLKPGGLAFVSTPYNFRIHGPLPDCWRFTEHGLRELFRRFDVLELNEVETPGRILMPVQYTLVGRKPGNPCSAQDVTTPCSGRS